MAIPNQLPPGQRPPGLFASLRRVGATLIAILQSRVELFAHEIERERVRVTRLLILGVVALFFLALGAVTVTIFVVVLFWDSQRLIAIGFLAALYLAIGGGLALYLKGEASRAARPFSASLEQLRKDREHYGRS
jgi:uncharacterized membrane protein YqjE